MQTHSEESADVERKRHNAGLVASALGGEVSWSQLSLKRKVGVTVAMLGFIALPLAFVQGWIWALSGGLAIVIGAWLTYTGIELKDKSPWPPYGPG